MAGASGNKLHAEKYENLILRRGRNVIWREAVTCSCWNLDSGQADYSCVACNGIGYVYEDPIEDVVLVQSVTHNKEFEAMAGVFEVGDAVMSVGYKVPGIHANGNTDTTMATARLNKLFHVGMNDLITLTDDEYKTSEVLVKGKRMYARPADTLLNDYVTNVLKVRKWNPVTGERTDYIEGTHYIVEGNRIVWAEGSRLFRVNKHAVNSSYVLGSGLDSSSTVPNNYELTVPAEGEQYTVVYEHRPTFTVFTNLPTPRYQDKQDLPRRVVIRYLAGGIRPQ